MRSIETFSMAELAKVSKDVIPGYNLLLENKTVDVEEEIMGLFDVSDEVSEFYRERLLACLRTIIDLESYKEDTPEIDDYTPPGFNYKNKQ